MYLKPVNKSKCPFFFTVLVSVDSMVMVGQHATSERKVFCMNLSAPFLCKLFQEQMMRVMPYVDILFGTWSNTLKLRVADFTNVEYSLSCGMCVLLTAVAMCSNIQSAVSKFFKDKISSPQSFRLMYTTFRVSVYIFESRYLIIHILMSISGYDYSL